MSEQITETGIRGFLKWFAREQPEIYKAVAPVIAKKVPKAFSDYHAGGWKVAGLNRDDAVDKLNKIYEGNFAGMGRLADASAYFSMGSSYTAQPTYFASAAPGFDASLATMPNFVDTSAAANAGSIGTDIAGTIGSIVNSASKAYLTYTAANTQSQIVNTQLQRAAAGLPPLNVGLSSSGIPMVQAGGNISTGSIAMLAIAGIGLYLLTGRKKS